MHGITNLEQEIGVTGMDRTLMDSVLPSIRVIPNVRDVKYREVTIAHTAWAISWWHHILNGSGLSEEITVEDKRLIYQGLPRKQKNNISFLSRFYHAIKIGLNPLREQDEEKWVRNCLDLESSKKQGPLNLGEDVFMARELGYPLDPEEFVFRSPHYKADGISKMKIVSCDTSDDRYHKNTPKVILDDGRLRREYYAHRIGLLSQKQQDQLFDPSHYRKILEYIRETPHKTDLRKGGDIGFLLFVAANTFGKS